ncbi:hypothetical protein BS78_03G152600 [Paspalum vaginatum]|nr:hypothetical protein BS78_03G152600 [Paspalum vaginatum]
MGGGAGGVGDGRPAARTRSPLWGRGADRGRGGEARLTAGRHGRTRRRGRAAGRGRLRGGTVRRGGRHGGDGAATTRLGRTGVAAPTVRWRGTCARTQAPATSSGVGQRCGPRSGERPDTGGGAGGGDTAGWEGGRDKDWAASARLGRTDGAAPAHRWRGTCARARSPASSSWVGGGRDGGAAAPAGEGRVSMRVGRRRARDDTKKN